MGPVAHATQAPEDPCTTGQAALYTTGLEVRPMMAPADQLIVGPAVLAMQVPAAPAIQGLEAQVGDVPPFADSLA